MDSLGTAGYLASVLDLLDREAEAERSEELGALYYDVLATRLAFVGDDEDATRYDDRAFGTPANDGPADAKSALIDAYRPAVALDAIAAAAREHRIVMINEEHRSSQQRAFANQLLVPLREAGYTHLAIETLGETGERLRARGYPVLSSGTYTRDPALGDLVRRALALGYVVIEYEAGPDVSAPRPDDTSPLDAINRRERGQAENIVARVFEQDPGAKLLVYAGRGHISESGDEWKPMGSVLKEATGLDPFTVDLTAMVEHSDEKFEHWAFRLLADKNILRDEPILMRAANGEFWSEIPGAFDATLFHPRTQHADGRPSWMTMGGLRSAVRVPIDSPGCTVLLQALVAGENDDAVPLDQAVWWREQAAPTLMLRRGDYVIRAVDRTGAVRQSIPLRVD